MIAVTLELCGVVYAAGLVSFVLHVVDVMSLSNDCKGSVVAAAVRLEVVNAPSPLHQTRRHSTRDDQVIKSI